MNFGQQYPSIDRFVAQEGWIEIGQDHYSTSFVRAIDLGGMVWEGEESYESMDAMLAELEAALGQWLRENRP
jgi:hypothetical protein